MKTLIVEFHFSKFECRKPTTLSKKLRYRILRGDFGDFFENRHKEQTLLNSSEHVK